MRMRQLKSFIRACELGSITRAAAELNIAQPALGLHIRNLETEFGQPLLVRNVRGVVPTEEGEIVLAWARKVLKSTEQVRNQVQGMKAARRQIVTIGLSGGLTEQISSMLSDAVAEQLPGMDLRIIKAFSNDIVTLLSDQKIDLGLTFEAHAPTGFTAAVMLSERLCYISQRTEETGPIGFAEVVGRPLTLPGSPSSVRLAVEEAAREIGVRIDGRYDLNSIQTAKDLASCGLSGTILPFGAIADCVESPQISVRLVVSPAVKRTLYLLRPSDRPETDTERDLRGILERTLRTFVLQDPHSQQFWILPSRVDQAA